ncbi:hypothetical protein CHLRE_06g300550v5 [Chlamydomonas reinhardtii]|uniref:Uncharacterized protein n=1 Tax=Chlamydomonas reinhardtii TaxID=3055 RepID=A0A2K3DQY7_CHLRE|nr:uncharacterized protein CHLRE_06g300550v5 [Chlamydomonas reinhardtii]PNW82944.1 hypothetical protein CHLRE_06g300550v5 [Chlamydomonas reinhardtii]7XZI_E Chain E, Tic100 [Chlamydomonas reinhardtii]7XZJ_E Chain E, Tic100 [Chlamydomonas reinhardtii]
MASKKGTDAPAALTDPLKEDPTVIRDEAQFPEPSLYFKVFESEAGEPEAKIRADVNKLYDRWIEKYGRRWPEDGINTEDMVWLAEEANKRKRAKPRPRGTVAAEKTEYEDEFMPDPTVGAPVSAADAAKAARRAKKDRKKKKAAGGAEQPAGPRTNYEKTVAGGKWVTDEFESADYEAGNLEKLWDMYLWDREGKPTMMPDTPAAQQEGEESEDFDDFYTAYRPRDVDSEEAREAVWATDEFESDEDNTESEWAPEYVGAGLGLVAEDPLNPQYSLRHSNHPLAPFPGEPLKWASYVYPDFTTFEGLSKQSIPHGMGVMTFGTGTGAGFAMSQTRYGDKYEGEFQAGYAHGLGQFTSEASGEVYIGEFFAGQRHGCGMTLDMKPYFYLLERGVDPVEAYRRTAGAIMKNVEVRTWYRGNKLGDAKEDEVVEINVLKDELDDPFEIALRNSLHDAKLRKWKAMSPQDKAMDRIVSIIERVQRRNPGRFGAYYREDEKGRVRPVLDSDGADTDFDSVDMIQGVDTDGDLGPGWEGATDSEENPMDPRIRELMAAEGMDDKLEDEGFKDTVLGSAIINPYTGLDMKTYLDGKERHQAELVSVYKASREGRKYLNKVRKDKGGAAKDDESSYVEDDAASGHPGALLSREAEDDRLARLYEQAGVSKEDERRVEGLAARWRRLLAADEEEVLGGAVGAFRRPGNPLAANDSDTGFETESDMMEMCDIPEILGTVQEARQIVERARMWRFKPYGEVGLRMAQDANGSPVSLMQEPLHYPHGTKFMAPGPLGLCHAVPDDPSLRQEMAKVAHNYAAIYRMYNFDWDPEPGTVQYKIDQRIRRAQELRNNAMARYLAAADEVLRDGAAPAGEGDQALLLASTSTGAPEAFDGQGNASGSGSSSALSSRGGSMFASMTLSRPAPMAGVVSLGRAARVVLGAFADAAKSVPMARPRLARPSGRRQ